MLLKTFCTFIQTSPDLAYGSLIKVGLGDIGFTWAQLRANRDKIEFSCPRDKITSFVFITTSGIGWNKSQERGRKGFAGLVGGIHWFSEPWNEGRWAEIRKLLEGVMPSSRSEWAMSLSFPSTSIILTELISPWEKSWFLGPHNTLAGPGKYTRCKRIALLFRLPIPVHFTPPKAPVTDLFFSPISPNAPRAPWEALGSRQKKVEDS